MTHLSDFLLLFFMKSNEEFHLEFKHKRKLEGSIELIAVVM